MRTEPRNEKPPSLSFRAGFIGEEIWSLSGAKQQIPRAKTFRFGMTKPSAICDLRRNKTLIFFAGKVSSENSLGT